LLCELLDASTTDLHRLVYSLGDVKKALESGDTGLTLDVEFETHAHSRHFEAKTSGADLGLVLSINHPILGCSKRAVLLQAKKLFASRKQEPFTLYSAYDSFDPAQAKLLQAIADRFYAWKSIYYLWYNPTTRAFDDTSTKHIRSSEATANSITSWDHHPFRDELLEFGYPFVFGSYGQGLVRQAEDQAATKAWRLAQPAMRVSSLEAALNASNGVRAAPLLQSLYQTLARRSELVSFSPFADFMMLALLDSRIGNSGDDWIELAEGRLKRLPPKKPTNQQLDPDPLGDMIHPPVPRHTVRVSIRSTLPSID